MAKSLKASTETAQFTTGTGTKKAIALTFVTNYGLVKNQHSGMVQKELTMEALFDK